VRFAVESVGNHRAGPLLAFYSQPDYLVGHPVETLVYRAA
jgi:hypothetical protein